MPKKTNRSVRALQAQRNAMPGGERKSAARPLVDIETSNRRGGIYPTPGNSTQLIENPELEQVEVEEVAMPRRAVAPILETSPAPVRPSASSPATTRRPVARRTTATTKQPIISREEEYAFIRADLMAVFLLTVLMIIVLIALTFIVGR